MDEFDYDEKPGLEREEQEEPDYDDGPEMPVKEEPDCYSCNDSGCPDCGHIDPADPAHRQYVAAQIIQSRALAAELNAPAAEESLRELVPEATADDLAAIQELIGTAVVTVTANWITPGAGGWSDIQPF